MSHLLRWLDLSTSKFHDWKHRFGKVNEHNAWIPRDHWLTGDEQEKIRTFARQNPTDGCRHLTYRMLDDNIVACSPSSVYRVLKKAGLLAGVTPVSSNKGTGFEQPLSAHCHWHIDVSDLNIAGTFYFFCSVLDCFSRKIVHHEIREQMAENDVEIILQRARECHPGVTPRVISDNGPQFIAREFKEFICLTGMSHVKTSPYYPQSNGKIERFHKTLKGECIRVKTPPSLDDARRIVQDYVIHYNTVRLHSAIGYITPQDMIDGKQQQIHAERDRKLAEARERRKQLRQASTDIHVAHADNAPSASENAPTCHPGDTRPAIDFDAVKAMITIAMVLKLLGIEVMRTQHRGPCPLHGSTNPTSTSFSANCTINIFQCFKCGNSGNALDLWCKAQKLTPNDAAVDLCNRLGFQLPLLNP